MSAKPKITGRATRDWQELDARHYLHPFTDFRALAPRARASSCAARACTSAIREGHEILDAMSGLWCVNIGYGRHELADAAAKQMRELPYYNSFFKSAHPPAIELAQLLDELTPQAVPPRVLHAVGLGGERHHPAHGAPLLGPDGPAEALGRHQPPQRLPRQHRWPAASLGGMAAMHAQGGLPIPDIVHIEQPYWYENGDRPVARGIRPARRAAPRGEDRGTRPRARRRLHRRAGAGRGRRDRPAVHLLARDPAHLPRVRHPADRRRGDLRLRPHRPLVRQRVLRHRAGLHDDRQGHHLRLPAARRRDGLATAWPTC